MATETIANRQVTFDDDLKARLEAVGKWAEMLVFVNALFKLPGVRAAAPGEYYLNFELITDDNELGNNFVLSYYRSGWHVLRAR